MALMSGHSISRPNASPDAEGTLVGIDLQDASKCADIERLIVSRLPFHELEAA